MNSSVRNILVSLCLVGLAGCASVAPLKHVLLSAPPQSEHGPARPSQWEVSRVHMPEYLDSYDIQLRTNDFVVTQLSNAKWAERLPVAMTHLLQQTIDERLQANRDRPYRVDVTVDTFEPDASGHVVLSARWKVTNTRADEIVAHDDALITKPLPSKTRDPDDIGQAMSNAVRELAARIVSAAG